MRYKTVRTAGGVIVIALAAETGSELLHHEDCDPVEAALCAPFGLEPPNVHTHQREYEPRPMGAIPFLASGANSTTTSSGFTAADGGTLRWRPSRVRLAVEDL